MKRKTTRRSQAEIAIEMEDQLLNSTCAVDSFHTAVKHLLKKGKSKQALKILESGLGPSLDELKSRIRTLAKELKKPLRIGITGGIACGKSSVSEHLAKKGVLVIDTDDLTHQLLAKPNPTYRAVLARFGDDLATQPGGPIDRKRLGRIIFSNPQAKKDLEGIMHPAINKLMLQQMETHKPGQVVAVQVPLLFEVGLQHKGYFDEIWTIKVDPAIQLERLMKRNNLTQEEALRRINAQMSQDEKARLANRVIDNSGSLQATRALVTRRLRAAMTANLT